MSALVERAAALVTVLHEDFAFELLARSALVERAAALVTRTHRGVGRARTCRHS